MNTLVNPSPLVVRNSTPPLLAGCGFSLNPATVERILETGKGITVPVVTEFIGSDLAIAALRNRARVLAGYGVPLVISGPPGSGRTFLAKCIHGEGGGNASNLFEFDPISQGAPAGEDAIATALRDSLLKSKDGTFIVRNIGAIPLPAQAILVQEILNWSTSAYGSEHSRPPRIIICHDPEGPTLHPTILLHLSSFTLTIPPLSSTPARALALFCGYAQALSQSRGCGNFTVERGVLGYLTSQFNGNVSDLFTVVTTVVNSLRGERLTLAALGKILIGEDPDEAHLRMIEDSLEGVNGHKRQLPPLPAVGSALPVAEAVRAPVELTIGTGHGIGGEKGAPAAERPALPQVCTGAGTGGLRSDNSPDGARVTVDPRTAALPLTNPVSALTPELRAGMYAQAEAVLRQAKAIRSGSRLECNFTSGQFMQALVLALVARNVAAGEIATRLQITPNYPSITLHKLATSVAKANGRPAPSGSTINIQDLAKLILRDAPEFVRLVRPNGELCFDEWDLPAIRLIFQHPEGTRRARDAMQNPIGNSNGNGSPGLPTSVVSAPVEAQRPPQASATKIPDGSAPAAQIPISASATNVVSVVNSTQAIPAEIAPLVAEIKKFIRASLTTAKFVIQNEATSNPASNPHSLTKLEDVKRGVIMAQYLLSDLDHSKAANALGMTPQNVLHARRLFIPRLIVGTTIKTPEMETIDIFRAMLKSDKAFIAELRGVLLLPNYNTVAIARSYHRAFPKKAAVAVAGSRVITPSAPTKAPLSPPTSDKSGTKLASGSPPQNQAPGQQSGSRTIRQQPPPATSAASLSPASLPSRPSTPPAPPPAPMFSPTPEQSRIINDIKGEALKALKNFAMLRLLVTEEPPQRHNVFHHAFVTTGLFWSVILSTPDADLTRDRFHARVVDDSGGMLENWRTLTEKLTANKIPVGSLVRALKGDGGILAQRSAIELPKEGFISLSDLLGVLYERATIAFTDYGKVQKGFLASALVLTQAEVERRLHNHRDALAKPGSGGEAAFKSRTAWLRNPVTV